MIKWVYWDERKTLFTTYSDDATKKLLQVETGRIYNSATDVIIGHREENGEQVPYGRFTYKEIDKTEARLKKERKYDLQHEVEENQGTD